MTKRELNSAAHKLRKLNAMKKELENQIAELEGTLKAEMTATGTDELNGSDWRVSWHEIETSRFDVTAFKNENPGVYSMYQKVSTTRRFLIA